MRILLTLILFLSTAAASFSQPGNGKETSIALTIDTIKLKAATNDFCICFSVISDSIHPYILEMVDISVKKGEKAATDTLTARITASPDQFDAVTKSLALMEGEKFETTLAKCIQAAEKKYPPLAEENDADGETNKYFIGMMERLPSCKFIYLLMKAGEKDDD